MTKNLFYLSFALLVFHSPTAGAASSPTAGEYLDSVALVSRATHLPNDARAAFVAAHVRELEAASMTIRRGKELLEMALRLNNAAMHKYGHAVFCNYDEETGPSVENLITSYDQNQKQMYGKSDKGISSSTLTTYLDGIIADEILNEFGCNS